LSSIISSSVVQLAVVGESTWGTTPDTPAFQRLRVTSDSLSVDRTNTTSSERRPDRNVTDLVQTGGGASGTLDMELSYGTFDSLMESWMQSGWTSDVIKNGVTPKSFSMERKIPRGADPDEYMRFTGMEVNSMSLTVNSGEIVTGSIEFLGMGGSLSDSIIEGATYTAETTDAVISAASGFADISLGSLTGAHVLNMDLSGTNNLRAASQLGSTEALGIGNGRFELTGNIEVYFEDAGILGAYLAGTGVSLSFTLGNEAGKKYTFLVPNLKFNEGGLQVGGNDDDLITKLSWQGLYDASEDCTLKITRAVE